MDRRSSVDRRAALVAFAATLLGFRTASESGSFTVAGYSSPSAGSVLAEVHDAIDASCTDWTINAEGTALSCNAGSETIDHSMAAFAEGVATFSDVSLPANMTQDACVKVLVDEQAAGDLADGRVGVVLGGAVADATDGMTVAYVDNAFGSGELKIEAKYWDGDSLENPTSGGFCNSSDPMTVSPGDWLVVCVDGVVGSGATIDAWAKSADPCPAGDSCQTAFLGTPDATMSDSVCNPAPSASTGSITGIYALGKSGGTGLRFDGDFAAWALQEPAPFTSLAVAPGSSTPSMVVGEAVPSDLTVTVGNDGNDGTIGGTIALVGTPEDCQPTTGGNTTWLATADGTWSGVTPTMGTSETISFAGATSCEVGSYDATLEVICTSGSDCDDDPQTLAVTLVVNSVPPPGSWPLKSEVGHDGTTGSCPAEGTFTAEGNWLISAPGLYENRTATRLDIEASGVTVRCAKITGPTFCQAVDGCGDLWMDWVTWDDVDGANALLLEGPSGGVKISNSKAINGYTDWIQGNSSFDGLEVLNVWVGAAHKTPGSHNDVMQMRGHKNVTVEQFFFEGGIQPDSPDPGKPVSGALFIEHELNVAYGGHRRWWVNQTFLGTATRELRFGASSGCNTNPCVFDRGCFDNLVIAGGGDGSLDTSALTPTGPGAPDAIPEFDPADHVGFWGNVRADDDPNGDHLENGTPIPAPTSGTIVWQSSCPFAPFRCPSCGFDG